MKNTAIIPRALLSGIFLLLMMTADSAVNAETLVLQDGWEYRWGRAASPGEMEMGEWISMEKFPGQPPGREGSRFLLLRVRLPEIREADTVLYIKSIHSLFEIYAGGDRIYSFGNLNNPADMPLDGLKAHFVTLQPEISGTYLYFQIYSKVFFIGIQNRVIVGGRAEILLDILKTELDQAVLAVLFICAGLISFLISQRVKGTRAFFYFGLTAVFLGLYTFRYTVLKQFVLNYPVFWLYVWLSTICLMPVGVIGIFKHIFGPGRRGVVDLLFKINVGYAALFILAVAGDTLVRNLFVGRDLVALVILLRFILLGLILADICVLAAVAAAQVREKDGKARIFLIGLALLTGFAMHDVISAMGVNNMLNFDTRIHWGMLGFLTALVLILVNHFREIQETLIRVQEELGLSKRIQQWILDEPVLLLDGNKKIIMTNLKTEELLGKKREELTSLHYSEIIDEHLNISGEIDKLLRGGYDSFSCRFHFKNLDNVLIDAKISRVADGKDGETNILIRGIELKGSESLKESFGITKRETEIIEYILMGFTNRLIASELNITERTVKSHITSIYGKLVVSNKVQLLNKLKDENLIPGYTADRAVLLRTN